MATAGLRKLFDGVDMIPKGIFFSEKCDPLGTSIHDLSADILVYVIRAQGTLLVSKTVTHFFYYRTHSFVFYVQLTRCIDGIVAEQ